MRKLVWGFSFLVLILFSGCASVPLRTMIKLRNFSMADVIVIEPNGIRAQIIHSRGMSLQKEPGANKFELYFVNNDQVQAPYKFDLAIAGRQEETKGLFRKRRVARTTLKLPKSSVEEFVKLQKMLMTPDFDQSRTQFSVSVSFKSSEGWDYEDDNEFSVLIKLHKDEHYITLIKDARIDFGKLKENGKDVGNIDRE